MTELTDNSEIPYLLKLSQWQHLFGTLDQLKPAQPEPRWHQEPVDVLRYQIEHPDFPHQSTADQFFDEAQWESYRKLGETTATELKAAITQFLS